MFSKLIRDWQISKNHKKRTKSIILRSNDEIVRALDSSRMGYLDSERQEDKDGILRFEAIVETLEWITGETK